MAKASWVKLSKTSGYSNGSVDVSAEEHTGRISRTSELTFTASGVNNVKRIVKQMAKPEFVELDGNMFGASSPSGGIVNITGRSNAKSLTFSFEPLLGTLWGKVELTDRYAIGDMVISNGADIDDDPGASKEYVFLYKLALPENVSTTIDGWLRLVVTTESGATAKAEITVPHALPTLEVEPTGAVEIPWSGTAVAITVKSNTNWEIK